MSFKNYHVYSNSIPLKIHMCMRLTTRPYGIVIAWIKMYDCIRLTERVAVQGSHLPYIVNYPKGKSFVVICGDLLTLLCQDTHCSYS